jgi:hypothetical protein
MSLKKVERPENDLQRQDETRHSCDENGAALVK